MNHARSLDTTMFKINLIVVKFAGFMATYPEY